MVRWAKGVALPKGRGQWITWNAVEHQITQAGQQFNVGVALPIYGVGLPGAFGRNNQLVELGDQQLVAKQSPTVAL